VGANSYFAPTINVLESGLKLRPRIAWVNTPCEIPFGSFSLNPLAFRKACICVANTNASSPTNYIASGTVFMKFLCQ
jgi:hypothetical protein